MSKTRLKISATNRAIIRYTQLTVVVRDTVVSDVGNISHILIATTMERLASPSGVAAHIKRTAFWRGNGMKKGSI